ncbi:isocitrate lyase/phosphoenolpyruvate mutase family protein [Caenimonas soli]|uniref:isocitrate lyase/phosphoenolpyruvate mutase family protein n=1 Tax=Caenimonas soli TaxID=2735555 RepID=UPI0015530CB3|nr:isocitrate lyase/phosphoenolpyruvate mutase family protein [Caenimonas soli]NPC58540.1 hypothetical protein [Caenimonas soli]
MLDELGQDAPLLVGRAENFWTGRLDLADTILRLKAYARASADVLYAPGVATREEVSLLVREVHPTPLNVLANEETVLTVSEFEALGVRRISVSDTLERSSAWGGFMRAARSISDQGRFNFEHPANGGELDSFFRFSVGAPAVLQATIVGAVEYRIGEGPLGLVRPRTAEITLSLGDVVFTWGESTWREEAAMPFANFCRYVADGAIMLMGT